MNKNQALVRIASAVTALADIDDGAPESTFYLAFGANLDEWNAIRHVLVKGGLVEIKSHWVRLTAKGRALAAELNQALKEKK